MKRIILAIALSIPFTLAAKEMLPPEKMLHAEKVCEPQKKNNQFGACIMMEYRGATREQVDFLVEAFVKTFQESGDYQLAIDFLDSYIALVGIMPPDEAFRTTVYFILETAR